MPVVYLDEICFTKQNFPRKALSLRNQNIKVDQHNFYVDYYIAAIVAVSEAKGLVHVRIEYGAVDVDVFLAFLRTLVRKMDSKPFTLYLDQLPVHKTTAVKDFCEENDIMLIFNVSYSPELNPIETTFSTVK